MHIKNLKYLLSLIISLYLLNKISKEIYINLSQLKVLKEVLEISEEKKLELYASSLLYHSKK